MEQCSPEVAEIHDATALLLEPKVGHDRYPIVTCLVLLYFPRIKSALSSAGSHCNKFRILLAPGSFGHLALTRDKHAESKSPVHYTPYSILEKSINKTNSCIPRRMGQKPGPSKVQTVISQLSLRVRILVSVVHICGRGKQFSDDML